MIVLEEEDQELYDRVQEQNLGRQYGLMTNCIEIGLKQGPRAFDRSLLWSLNHAAVTNISAFGGRFRQEPIYVGDHKPPHFKEVDEWMDRFISTIHENWYIWTPTELGSRRASGSTSLQRRPRSSDARKPVKIAVNSSGRQRPVSAPTIAFTSLELGIVYPDFETALGAPLLTPLALPSPAPDIANDVPASQPALLRVSEHRSE